jgi:uncharacterized membrane protein required for colicin V production
MIWVDIIITIFFIFSFIAGLREGAVKAFFALIGLIIAIPIAGHFHYLLTSVLGFIPNNNWQNFIGFFGTLAIVLIILAIILFIPTRLIEGIWGKGVIFTILGGVFSVIGFTIALMLFTIIVDTYPICYWLEQVLPNSSIIDWLMGFSWIVYLLLPATFGDSFETVFLNSKLPRLV